MKRSEVVKLIYNTMCFTDKLGTEFNLPDSPELDRAVLLINKLCSEEVYKMQKIEDAEWLETKAKQVRLALLNGYTESFKQHLEDIQNYHKGKK